MRDVVDRAAESLGESLPGIAGGLVLLLVGLPFAWLAGRLVRRVLNALGIDALAERFQVHDAIERVGLPRSLARVLGGAVRIALTVVVVLAAMSIFGLRALSGSLNEAVLFLPKLFIALVLVLAGVIASQYGRGWVDRLTDQMALGTALGRIVQLAIAAVFAVTALSTLGVPTDVLMMVVTVSLVAVAAALALAFGLGSRDLARQMTAGRYVATTFAVGQRIGVAEFAGEIVALESASAVIRTDDGRTLRVPNHLLLDSIVTVDDSPSAGAT